MRKYNVHYVIYRQDMQIFIAIAGIFYSDSPIGLVTQIKHPFLQVEAQDSTEAEKMFFEKIGNLINGISDKYPELKDNS